MSLGDSPSKNLREHGQAQLIIQLFHGCFAAIYCAAAAIMDGPIMDPAIYGDVVTSVPAEYWSWPILIVCMIYILGILINGNWRWSPALRLFSAVAQTLQIGSFGLLAFRPDSLDPFVVGCAVLAAFNIWCIFLNLGDAARGIRNAWNAKRN